MTHSLLQTARDNRIKALRLLQQRREIEQAENNVFSLSSKRLSRRHAPVFRSMRSASLFMEYDARQAA